MSNLYNIIETKVNDRLSNEDYIVTETQLKLTVQSRLLRSELKEAQTEVQTMAEENARRKIIHMVYGGYANELVDVISMLYNKEKKDVVIHKIKEIISSMLNSKGDE